MFNVCEGCGEYRADKDIDSSGLFAICPECGFKHEFLQLPLFLICGPSGTGKSTVCNRLAAKLSGAVALDGDILWRAEFAQPENNYQPFFETWLRLCKNIGQSGNPVVLANAGANPNNIEKLIERRYFTETHYLAMICDEEVLRARLQSRPNWRESQSDEFIQNQVNYTEALKKMSLEKPARITLLDTSRCDVDHSVTMATQWITAHLP